jgi:hypothetical protein
MSAAATAQVAVPEVKQPVLIPGTGAPTAVTTPTQTDEHAIVPIVFAFLIAVVASTAFVGSIIFWLAIRHSGVVWP